MAQKKVWARELQVKFGLSITKSCQVVMMSRRAYYYEPKLLDDTDIIEALNSLVEKSWWQHFMGGLLSWLLHGEHPFLI